MSARVSFEPPVTGPAYGRGFRAAAAFAALGLLAWGARTVLALGIGRGDGDGWIVLGAAAFALLGTLYFMITSRTTIDAQGIRQSGLIERKTEWSDILYARVRGPAFSRRLVVRSVNGRFRYYFGGTRELLAAFDQIAAAYPRRR
ncbi:MAG: hypothetical protein ACM3PU_13390 [Gemmatimonadota bacterium]